MGSDVSSSAKMQPIAQMSAAAQNNIKPSVKQEVKVEVYWSWLDKEAGHKIKNTDLTNGFGIVPSPQQQFRCSVPESDHHRVEIG